MRRSTAALAVVLAALAAEARPAAAAWELPPSDTPATARAGSLVGVAGAQPTAALSDTIVTLSWAGTTLSAPTAYVVRRASTEGGAVEVPCPDALTCMDSPGPGTWTYTVQPRVGTWLGAEGPSSDPVTLRDGKPELARSAPSEPAAAEPTPEPTTEPAPQPNPEAPVAPAPEPEVPTPAPTKPDDDEQIVALPAPDPEAGPPPPDAPISDPTTDPVLPEPAPAPAIEAEPAVELGEPPCSAGAPTEVAIQAVEGADPGPTSGGCPVELVVDGSTPADGPTTAVDPAS